MKEIEEGAGKRMNIEYKVQREERSSEGIKYLFL